MAAPPPPFPPPGTPLFPRRPMSGEEGAGPALRLAGAGAAPGSPPLSGSHVGARARGLWGLGAPGPAMEEAEGGHGGAPPSSPDAGRKEKKTLRRYWEGGPGGPEPDSSPNTQNPQRPPDGGPSRKPERPTSKRRIARVRIWVGGLVSNRRLKRHLASQEEKAESAAKQAARMELLLLEEPG
ncbi:hypothetical protein JD844_014003 [Phrynosoma platyrhinos]|uniref:Uncharacterized protein n=1 Tax=Phrynosoma platyrhinos TaxID=52577 RepID=A0ABQ7TMM3_PHRPL|nr:hypothetical protein JD844_014003 [Phrynosoma platyrhinos]